MKWNRYSLEDYPYDLWQQWDRLNQLYCNTHPLLDSRFVQPLTQFFPGNIEVLAGVNGDVTTVLALLERSKGLVQTPYLPSQTQIALLLVPGDISQYAPIGTGALGFPACRLDLLSVDSEYQSSIILLKNSVTEYKGTDMVIDIKGEFSEYWSHRTKNLRKNISRYQNRITKELGGYEFKIVQKKEEMELAVARYGFIESRGWKGKLHTALHPGNKQGNFYRSILENFSKSGGAFVFELWVKGEVVASRLCISNNELLIVLKTTFDEKYKKYAFGRILLHDVLLYLFESRSVDIVDLYTNASKEQLDWATRSRPTYNVSLYQGITGAIFKQALLVKHALIPQNMKKSRDE